MNNSPVIPWTTRSDLMSTELGEGHEAAFAVKDQLRNEFYRFGELEFFILQSLRKRMTIDGLQQAIKSRFGWSITTEDVTVYIHRLASDNLLIGNRLGDGQRLAAQSHSLTKNKRWQQTLGVLSVKLPGFYPGPLLDSLKVIGQLVFSPVSIAMVLIAALLTTGYVVLAFGSVWQRVPTFEELTSSNHLVLMMAGFIIAKILHELGHGLACRNAGRECSEMGVLLLVLLPCLYCDVSDMWTQPSRWKRIFVSLAGVFVELMIAILCFWGWYFTLDGSLNRFFFGLMLITSINTLFINGNPLMRYDGYYALSDFVNVPNLASVAQSRLTKRIHHFFASAETEIHTGGKTAFLLCYAVGSFFYRWLILAAIGWAVWTFFDSQQLAAVGRIVVGSLILLSVLPLILGVRNSIAKIRTHGLRWINAIAFFAVLALILLLLANITFSHRVTGTAEFQLADARQLFAPADGTIIGRCQDGQVLKLGEVIAEITDVDLSLEKLTVEAKLADVETRLKALQFSQQSTVVAGEIEFWKKRLLSWQRKFQEINQQQEDLTVRSPAAGQIIIASRTHFDPETAKQNLSLFSGSWADPENRGSHVQRGDNLCYVADQSKLRGTMSVGEQEIELVEVDQPVQIFLPHQSDSLSGLVTKISLENQQSSVNIESSNAQGVEPDNSYTVEFQFESDGSIRVGSRSKAVILCRKTTPLGWMFRWLSHSFWF